MSDCFCAEVDVHSAYAPRATWSNSYTSHANVVRMRMSKGVRGKKAFIMHWGKVHQHFLLGLWLLSMGTTSTWDVAF